MNKKVSVIIPTYKRSDYLLRAIESVVEQKYNNIEIIVVDDNDPNSNYRALTEEKMKTYEKNTHIKYIKNEKNVGGALARNIGVKESSGDYITFLDDDDIYLPNKIINQIRFMLDSNLDMSFSDVRIHNMQDVLIDYREHSYVNNFSKEELLKMHILHHLTPTATYMYRKDAFELVGGFSPIKMGQEFILMLKTIESGMKIGYLPEANVIQYLHDGERISIGSNKIEGEKDLYNLKKNYLYLLSKKERNYVKFRHLLVLGVVGYRSKNNKLMIENLIKALLTSPQLCLVFAYKHTIKLKNYK